MATKKVLTSEEVAADIEEAKVFDPRNYLGKTVLVTLGMNAKFGRFDKSGATLVAIITSIRGDTENQLATLYALPDFDHAGPIVWESVPNKRFGDESTHPPYWELL